jgi:Fe-S-cluster containining protein
MVMPDEIRKIISATGNTWSEIAEPFPERIPLAGSGSYTFGWCVKRREGTCNFMDQGRCRVYEQRPWICRTFPFMLDGDELRISDCPGIGQEISRKDAITLALDLLRRREIEDAEEEQILSIMSRTNLDPDTHVVIDSESRAKRRGKYSVND